MRTYTLTEAQALARRLAEAHTAGYSDVSAAAYALASLLHDGYELRRFLELESELAFADPEDILPEEQTQHE